jgi:predicted small secreted protein
MSIVPIENAAAESEWIKKQNAVYDDWVKGEQNFTALAKRHNVTRAKAIEMVEEVKQYMQATGVFKDMAKERLHEMNHHYSMLIKEGWTAVDEMKEKGQYDRVPGALKVIGDLEAKRQEALQKSGMYDDYEMGDMLAESERKIDSIRDLLRNVIKQFPATKNMILDGLRDIQEPDRLPDPDVIDGETA